MFQMWRASFIGPLFQTHDNVKDNNKYDAWADVKSTDIGAGGGNFYEKSPWMRPL
jgi:hypothetical protein